MMKFESPPMGRNGTRLKQEVLQRVFAVMTEPTNDGKTQKEIAKLCNIAPRTLHNYLTHEVWEHIRTLRLDVMSRSLQEIDRAVYAKAAGGDIAAAKLIYSRWEEEKARRAELKIAARPRTLDEINAELQRLREEIDGLEQRGAPADKCQTTRSKPAAA